MLFSWIPDELNLSLISLFITFVILLIVNYYRKAQQLPPGPTGLPIVGYWPFLCDKTDYLQLNALKKKYGDFYSFTIPGHLIVHLGSYKILRESQLAQFESFGRYQGFSLLNSVFSDGVGFINGEGWKILRAFFLQVIKERCLLAVKDSLSGSMYDSINSAIQDLKATDSKPVDINNLLIGKCNTIFRQTMFGESVSEERLWEMNQCFAKQMNFMTAKKLMLSGTFARYFIFPFYPGFRDFLKNSTKIEEMMYKIIEEHISTYDEEHMRDIIDEYIKERNDRKIKGDPTARHFTDKALMATSVQVIADGGFTVSAHIIVTISSLLSHPEEQDKIYNELMEVVGVDRQPLAEDKSKLPYTNAFIMEALRTSELFPFFPSLQCIKDTTVRGFKIPKGAITILNKWTAHHDPEVFEDPMKFNPSRFLNKNEKKRTELPLTFGIGKRTCVGEGFIMLQMFLFLTTIIKNFRITADTSQENFPELLISGELRIRFLPRTLTEN